MDRVSAKISQDQAGQFRRRLLGWYQKHKRQLPWRKESDPYRILVSEIMLQQTRVAVVEDRYRKFLAQFPSAARLARAKEATVLAAWSGLGYYRRARNLQAAAKEITGKGKFPRTAEALRELPGIGRYTAAAVASIAFGEPVAVVDGNVKRLLQRLLACPDSPAGPMVEEQYWESAGRLLDSRRPGDFNQAMMELGAMICLPSQPLCHSCPVSRLCAARGPLEKAGRQARRKATLHYALIRKNGSIRLQQRAKEHSLMPGMWELPELESVESNATPLLRLRHSITTTDYTVFVHAAEHAGTGRWVPLRSVSRLPLTGLTNKIIRSLRNA
jgi:A/G-specific adenine glycosylase